VRARLVVLVLMLLLVGLLGASSAYAAGGNDFAPVAPDSSNAQNIRDSYLFVSIFVVAIFLLVEGLLIAFILKYRRRKRSRFEDGAPIHGSSRLELAWTAFPVVVLFLIGAFIFWELPGIIDTPEAQAGDQLEVRITGRQFYWQFEYPNGVIAIDELRAPAGVPVRLQVTAPEDDVIHSWWIPALGGKLDAIPGRVNETWFQADSPGVYKGQCAELCGLGHADMTAQVDVMPQAEFDAWLETRRSEQTSGSKELGAETWQGVCAKCHGLYGQGGIGRPIGNSAILQDEQALDTLVRNGRRTMPAVGAGWTSEQVSALALYLKENPPTGQAP